MAPDIDEATSAAADRLAASAAPLGAGQIRTLVKLVGPPAGDPVTGRALAGQQPELREQ
jgi:hypothetical protein